MIGLKFNGQLIHAKHLGLLLAEHLKEQYVEVDEYPECIIPVPLHRRRIRERGFNQALEIAKPVSNVLNIPIDGQWVSRQKATQAQSTLPAKGRAQNISSAFLINIKKSHQHVAILDDIMTTGCTARGLAQVLRAARVERVDLWCVARALLG